jgi:hypothetical protein
MLQALVSEESSEQQHSWRWSERRRLLLLLLLLLLLYCAVLLLLVLARPIARIRSTAVSRPGNFNFPLRLSQPESQPHHLVRIQSSLLSTAMASDKRRLDYPCAARDARRGRQRKAGIGAGWRAT